MDEFKINTAHNVIINQNIAPVSTRISAFLIDTFIIGAYYMLLILLLYSLDFLKFADFNFIFLIISFPVFFYHLLFEVFMNGQTPGKYWKKTRVIMLDGSNPTFSSYLIRWMLRIFDISMTGGSLALISLLFNGKGQRIGDIAAGTTVISLKQKIDIVDTLFEELEQDYQPTFPEVTVLSDRDVQNIKIIYKDSIATKNHAALVKLSNKIKEITKIESDLLPVEFINIVLKDYNYYTQTM